MICQNPECGAQLEPSDRFCARCGIETGVRTPHHNIDISGGYISGGVYQSGRDIYLTSSPEGAAAEYQPKWSRKTFLTQSVLGWVSVILGTLSLFTGWQGFEAWYESVQNGISLKAPMLWWFLGFFLSFLMLILVLTGLKIVRNRTQHFSPLHILPSVTGWGGRIGLARLEGSCPTCGGSLKFYNKPIEWLTYPQSGRKKVTRRAPAAECKRNPDHWWTVDPTDGE